MAKKKELSLENLNINLQIDNENTRIKADKKVKESIEKALENKEDIVLDNIKFEGKTMQLVVNPDNPKEFLLVEDLDALVKMKTKKINENILEMKNGYSRKQLGILFDSVVNDTIKAYLEAINNQLKTLSGTNSRLKIPKVSKIEFTDAVIKAYLKDTTDKYNLKLKRLTQSKIDKVKNELFSETGGYVSYDKIIYKRKFDKSKQGLYITLEVYEKLIEFCTYIDKNISVSEYLNAIFRLFFIKQAKVDLEYFVQEQNKIGKLEFHDLSLEAFHKIVDDKYLVLTSYEELYEQALIESSEIVRSFLLE